MGKKILAQRSVRAQRKAERGGGCHTKDAKVTKATELIEELVIENFKLVILREKKRGRSRGV
jgi:hypothetical protein